LTRRSAFRKEAVWKCSAWGLFEFFLWAIFHEKGWEMTYEIKWAKVINLIETDLIKLAKKV
jgi:hypothetical protein